MVSTHPSLELPLPLITGLHSSTAHLLSLAFTSSYVGSIYLAKKLLQPPTSTCSPSSIPPNGSSTLPNVTSLSEADVQLGTADVTIPPLPTGPEPGSRDHPDTIKSRMKAVGVATASSLICVWGVVKALGGYSALEAVKPTLSLLGLGVPDLLLKPSFGSLLPYFLTPILFIGPLFANYLDGDLPFQHDSLSLIDRARRFVREWGLVESRNYLVGPITEELVFRSTILAVSILGGLSTRSLIFGTPLWFGLAHVHHAHEVWVRGGRTRRAAIQALAGCVFQLGYTTLFGWFATYLYLTTGSIFAPLSAHMFCNYMGIYLPTSAAAGHPHHKLSIRASYVMGLAGFTYALIKRV